MEEYDNDNGLQHWDPVNFMGDPEAMLFDTSPVSELGDLSPAATTTSTENVGATPPQEPVTATEQCENLIGVALRSWNSSEDLEYLQTLVQSTLTSADMVRRFFFELWKQPIHAIRLITARLGEAGFARLESQARKAVYEDMLGMLEAAKTRTTAEVREQLLVAFTLVAETYAITTAADLRSRVRDSEAREKLQKKQEFVRDYYAARDELVVLGQWFDDHILEWRTWPSRGRLISNRAIAQVDNKFVQFRVTLAPAVTMYDTEVRLAYAKTISEAQIGNGALLRLSDFRAHVSPPLRHVIYAHVVSIAEQMVVRALDHVQFIVLDGRLEHHLSGLFNSGVRRNWVTTASGVFVFVAPLTRLASEPGITREILGTARDLSYLLLPEMLQEHVQSRGSLLLHDNDIRIRVRELDGPVPLLRDLAAQGNRDGPRPLDICVSVLPFDRQLRLHVLGFLINLGQVWARRLVLEEPLASTLVPERPDTPSFWAGSSLAPMWPRFQMVKKNERVRYYWSPHRVEKMTRREALEKLPTHSKDTLAPSDSNPSFPRGLYGAESAVPDTLL